MIRVKVLQIEFGVLAILCLILSIPFAGTDYIAEIMGFFGVFITVWAMLYLFKQYGLIKNSDKIHWFKIKGGFKKDDK